MLEYEKAEKERIDKKIQELCKQKEKIDAELEQLWQDRSALLDRMIKIVEKK